MTPPDLPSINAGLAEALRDKLGIRRGTTLAQKLRHAGRLLPRAERKAGAALVEAERLWQNPKLRRQIDTAAMSVHQKRIVGFLDTVDLKDRRRGVLLGILASLAFNFLVIAGVVIWWLWYSGWL